jgi:predicted nucleotidyltransferase
MEAKEMQKLKKAWGKRFQSEENERKHLAEDAQRAASVCAELLAKKFGAKRVYLFGSAKDTEAFHKRSDIDLAVEGLSPQKYFTALAELRGSIPGKLDLDLVPLEDAYPELKKLIKSKGKLLYGKE